MVSRKEISETIPDNQTSFHKANKALSAAYDAQKVWKKIILTTRKFNAH
jgi:hypothetical protein